MARFILSSLYKLFGWKVEGKKPIEKKYIIIAAPHTSNWDFFVGWGFRNIMGFKSFFLIKKELIKIPLLGWFLSFIGAIPVDRKNKEKTKLLVEEVVKLFQERDEFIITIAPEGTRGYTPKWKTGFYRIAHQTGVPIVKVGLDYKTKTVFFDNPYYTKGNMDEEIEEMKNYFKNFTGKNSKNGIK